MRGQLSYMAQGYLWASVNQQVGCFLFQKGKTSQVALSVDIPSFFSNAKDSFEGQPASH